MPICAPAAACGGPRRTTTVSPRMSDATRLVRPATPPGHDPSRAAQRAADPRGWRYGDDDLEAVHRVIAERRDIRRFRPDPVPADVLDRILAAAHRAPSVGLMQPWRLIVIRGMAAPHRDPRRRRARAPAPGRPLRRASARVSRPEGRGDRRGAARRLRLLRPRRAGRGDPRPRHDPRHRRLQHRLRDPEPLARRARGGARRRLGELLPARRPARDPRHPGARGPDRLPLHRLARRAPGAAGPGVQRLGVAGGGRPGRDGGALGGRRRAAAAAAATAAAAADAPPPPPAPPTAPPRSAPATAPTGSSSPAAASARSSRSSSAGPPPAARRRRRACAPACSSAPPTTATPRHGTSLFGSEVSAQVAAAAARGETAAGVLARDGGHALLVADLGLRGETPPGLADHKVAPGSADMTTGPGLTADAARRRPRRRPRARRRSSTTAAPTASSSARSGWATPPRPPRSPRCSPARPPRVTVGRGTGLDAPALERKRALVDATAALHAGTAERPARHARRHRRPRARRARRRRPRGLAAAPAGRARRLRDVGRRARRDAHRARRRRGPVRQPPLRRARPRARPHRARPRAAARPAPAPRRGVRRAHGAADRRARRPAARADGDVRRGRRRRGD